MASRYHHHIFVTILSILLFPSSLKAQQSSLYHNCNTKAANYTKDSPFQTNLKSLLDSLSSKGSLTGYFNATNGTGTDRVYGLVQCRGDVNTSTCQSCLDVAPKDILDLCPNNTEAYIWYNYCFLRYSHQMFFSQPPDDFLVYMWNIGNITDEVNRYSEYLSKMMDPLALKGAYDSTERFATGEAMFSKEFPMLYGMVQCTMDQTKDDCYKCLRKILGDIPKCCAGKLGGRVLSSVCIVRYEVYKFYDGPPTLTTLPPPGASGPTALPTPGASGPTALPTPGASGPAALAHPAGKKKTARTILLLVIPLGTAFVFISVCCICFLKRKKAKQKHYRKSDWGEIASIESLLFALSAIRTATDDFSDATKVGQGGFGIVHKGVLENGQEIAVKRLSTSSAQGLKELKNEVVLLAKLQHRNLVKLLGVCVEEEEKLLIYEYVPNKSLDTFLFDDHQKEQLNWERRYKIITGVARGMLYLHEESQFKIIHRDLKASNVLLDADMIPKISDFGMAKLFEADQTHVSTQRVVGTLGYMSPEYAIRGQFSNKSDVFSFGVLVLEIMTGLKNSDFFNLRESTNLLSYVWSHWCHGSISEIMDPSFRGHCSYNEALRCIHIGLLCVQEAPNDRPTMSTVVLMLSSYSVTLQVPSQPAFLCSHSTSMPSGKIENVDIICSQDVNPQNNCRKTLFEKTEVQSINDATVSEFQPR